ncbi:complement factor H-related protein 1 isoform X6 [Oxyura jamaicensis]|uniref:complement factor H-related protein 1 isoform X6 n=1 Tax=Oxyura jamaicensis TaxID=8884 RepID=UPI0015A60892|nr:complement factor H-related protein 1 isoform X6 [Oxyura jamaicensis]
MTMLSLTTGFLLWMCCAIHKASAGAACEDPPLVEFGKIVSGVKSGYEENDRVQYTCNPGYALSGSEWVTCHGKVWMPGPPQCLEIPCGRIPAVANAVFEGRNKEKYEAGETIRYQCHEGFQVTGPPEIFCRRGNWSTPPFCEDVRCENPPEILNGHITSTQKEKYLPGAKVHYECEINSQIMGVNYVICSDGHWTQVPSCRDVTCEPPPEIAGGKVQGIKKPRYLPGETAHYQCWQDFQMTGASTVTCQNGTWTELPQCKAACTASEEDMDRNNIELRWRGERKLYSTSGDFIEFDCKVGYVQDPASSPFRVQCMDGTLEYPRCKRGRNCILSEAEMKRNNIKLRWSRKRSNTYRSKETILFTCLFSYQEVSNPDDFEAQCKDGVINYPRCEWYFG